MKLHNLAGRSRYGYTTFGSYWSQGEVIGTDFILKNQSEKSKPLQSRIVAWWPDGSVKWGSHTALAQDMGDYAEIFPRTFETDSGFHKNNTAGILIEKKHAYYKVDTGRMILHIPIADSKKVDCLATQIFYENQRKVRKVYPVFELENRIQTDKKTVRYRKITRYYGEIHSVELEETGPLQAVICFHGNHVTGEDTLHMPFVIRMYLWRDSDQMKIVHTFLYDGDEQRDYLKGMGICFESCIQGEAYNRHIQFCTDGMDFHEMAQIFSGSQPKQSSDLLRKQMNGEVIAEISADLPIWNRYVICQDSAWHYCIRKQTDKSCCLLTAYHGRRARGVLSVTGENGGMMVGIRNFWQKYPSGLEADGLSEDICCCTAWFYSPETESFDFRHYAAKSYARSCYEGFDEVGASACGIGVTSELRVQFLSRTPQESALETFAVQIENPPVYVGDPDYYHRKRAFGYWSLPAYETTAQRRLEEELDRIFLFYKKEVDARDWYGLFDYGDVMHTYDDVRHTWKYDTGGYAWQNTELVPTYWLWLYFMRTGREDVFTLAEAMSRHCSEVDVYHFGPLKGLGSRHNVRHWGCSCKEPRIGMAGHYRFLYYLTGDRRIGDVLADVKDSDHSAASNPHQCRVLPNGKMQPTARSGPDWSSYVSNWMTQYERTLDEHYRKKIETGIEDIAATPYGFASGPDFDYNVENAHLIYIGENEDTPNQHLQICMGGPQVWLETADMLGNDTLRQLLIRVGSFYYLPAQEKSRLTDGKIFKRSFAWNVMAAGVAAYSAMCRQDEKLAWQIMLDDLEQHDNYRVQDYWKAKDREYREIPCITTNNISQWCLNAIMCMEFIKEYLPDVDMK